MAKSTSDWASEIGYTDENLSDIVSACFYGPTGSGKTRLAGTFPDPFVINSDYGLKTLQKLHVPYYNLKKGGKTFEQVMVILADLKAGNPPFDKLKVKTLILDSLTELANYLIVDSMKRPFGTKLSKRIEDEKPEWDDYSRLSARLDTIIKTAKALDLNVVATAGRKMDKDETTGEYIGLPNIIGGYRDVVGHQFDEFYYMEPEQRKGETIYRVFTRKYGRYTAKSRSDLMDPVIEDPTYEKLYLT